MSEEPNQFPPALLFKSFLLVAGAYMINVVLLGAVAFGVLTVMFPESLAVINSPPEEFNRVFSESPEKIYPPELLWVMLGVSIVVCFGLGYFVARMAPLAKFPHSIFFAAILFVQYLQLAIGASDSLQRMLVLFMAASPVAAILGANWFLQSVSQQQEE